MTFYFVFLFCFRAKEKVGKCPSHSSVYSGFCGWLSCSVKEKGFGRSSGLLSSPFRSVPHRISTFTYKQHFWSSWVCSPQALPYVGLLIAMIFFIYAVIGMQVSLLSIRTFTLFYFHPPEFIDRITNKKYLIP